MKNITIKTELIESVSKRANMTPEQYIAHSRFVATGRKVSVTLSKRVGGNSVFILRG